MKTDPSGVNGVPGRSSVSPSPDSANVSGSRLAAIAAETTPAVQVACVSHRYGPRLALDGVSFSVAAGQIFGILGPNGGGKSTLFRVLSTLLPLQSGQIIIAGHSVLNSPAAVRHALGVTFQSPSLDRKLTVRENLQHQGHLYGLWGQTLRNRIDTVLRQLSILDRASELCDRLSGGLQRRVEIAKSLLHQPAVLVLDEPSTGLDPGARHELWTCLRGLRDGSGVTVLMTTHLMDEAEQCDHLVLLDSGRLVASGSPSELRTGMGEHRVTVRCEETESIAGQLREQLAVSDAAGKVHDSGIGNTPDLTIDVQPGEIIIRTSHGGEVVSRLSQLIAGRFSSITLGRPTLEDVFLARTGRTFWDATETGDEGRRGGKSK